MEKLKLFVVTGEYSGDVHAANLLKELGKNFELEIYGTGGPNLLKCGQEQYYSVQDMAVIGFDAAIRKIPFLLKVAGTLQEKIGQIRPDAILLVDYTGFNLRFAKKLKKFHIPVVGFVAHQVWIWHYSRVHTLARYFSKVLCILPFEEELLRKEGVNAVYIGNPITEGIKFRYPDKAAFYAAHNLDPKRPVVGLIPGSRPREIATLMPVISGGMSLLNDPSTQFILGRADGIPEEAIVQWLPSGSNVKILSGETHDVMRYSDILWICSGTATLEAAIIGTPMIILYITSRFNMIIAKMLTSLRMIGMPNIISGRYVVPEVIGGDCRAENLVKTHCEMIPVLEEYREALKPISEVFGGKTPMKTAAEEIVKTIRENRPI